MSAELSWFSLVRPSTGSGPILAIDGGATGSRAAIADLAGSVIAYAEGGPTNARAVGDQLAAENLGHLVRDVIEMTDHGDEQLGYCLLTIAGVDTVGHSEFMSGVITRLGLEPGYIATVPDTIGCWADTSGLDPAIVVISGTGSVVLAADLDRGLCQRFGGWDFLLGDEGSGFALGRAALREALLVSEGRSDAHEIAAECLKALGLHDASEISDAVHKPRPDKTGVAQLARIPLDYAERGDPHAQAIAIREAASLASTVVAGVRCLGDVDVKIGTYGSIFRSPFFRSQLEATVEREIEPLGVSWHSRGSALTGCFRLALWAHGYRSIQLYESCARFEATLPRPLS